MRYVVWEVVGEKDHQFEGETLYYLMDTFKKEIIRTTYYLKREVAEEFARKRNNG